MSEEQQEQQQAEVSDVNNENTSQPSESEAKARRLGWVPQDEWSGPAEKWRDADTFIRKGEEIHGYLKADLDKLQNTLTQKDREIAEIRATMDEFRKFHNETESRAYKRAIDELKQLKVEAIEQGDGGKVVEIDEKLDQLKEAQKTPKVESVKQAERVNQEYLDWLPDNKWYTQDPELQEMADDIGELVKKSNPNLIGKGFLEEVTKRVKRLAPEKFENPNRSASTVSSSSDGRQPPTGKKKKSYENLPQEAKQACDRFVKQKLMTREQYVNEFDWD